MNNKKINTFLSRIFSYTDYARRRSAPYTATHYNLDTMRAMLTCLKNPERQFRSIHIAGTKGKGSTAHYIAYLLQQSGYKTGLYTSPQIRDERDRMRINGRIISWRYMETLFSKIEKIALREKLKPTVFEFFTVMAFCWFKEKKVDYAVIETGLGGRLDSTNTIQPEISVITPIDYDHMDKLGHTLREIAGEKAGIIKPNTPVITSNTRTLPVKILKKTARINSSYFFQSGEMPPNVFNPDMPAFLQQNAALAAKTLEFLDIEINPEHLKNLPEIPGRYHLRGNILLDGAHNPFAFFALIQAVRNDPRFTNLQKHMLFFALPDKDIRGMLGILPRDWKLTFINLRVPYIANLADWKKFRSTYRPDAGIISNRKEIKKLVSGEGAVYIVTGSFLLVNYFLKNRLM